MDWRVGVVDSPVTRWLLDDAVIVFTTLLIAPLVVPLPHGRCCRIAGYARIQLAAQVSSGSAFLPRRRLTPPLNCQLLFADSRRMARCFRLPCRTRTFACRLTEHTAAPNAVRLDQPGPARPHAVHNADA